MEVHQNFCLFVEEKSVKWTWGNPDDEFLSFVINFLTGLSQIGAEIFGQHGVASIEFELKKRSGLQSTEIFIVSLMNKFFLIIADPAMTLKLIETKGGIPEEVQEIMSAVLVGQAAMLFSQSISEVDDEEKRKYLESLWQEIILDISRNYENEIIKIISKDSSNFSMLSFRDLLFLHYFLRKTPELIKPISPKGWALCSHLSGGEIPLEFNVIERDPVVLAGYLGIVISFIDTLFKAKPKNLIFGTNNLQRLSFINGEDYYLAIDCPITELMTDEDFYREFCEISDEVFKDLRNSIHKRIVEEILELQTQQLEKLTIENLLKNYVRIEAKKIKEDSFSRRRFLARIFGRL